MPQYRPLGTAAVPATWTLPPSLQLIVQSVYASYDGSGAAGSYIPTLEVISDAGDKVVSVPQDASVAAGSSVEATWAPFLRSATAGATPTVSGVPSALIFLHDSTFADTGFSLSTLNMDTASFLTNDSSVFSAATVGGNGCIQIAAAGDYMCIADAFAVVTSAPAAGSFCQTDVQATFLDTLLGPRTAGWFDRDGFGDYYSEPTRGVTVTVVSPGAPPPQNVFMRVGQNSGATADVHASLTVYQMSPAVPS